MIEDQRLTPQEIEIQQALGDSGVPLYLGGLRFEPFHPVTGIFSKTLMPVVSFWFDSLVPTAEEVELIRDAGREVARIRFGSTPEEGVFADGAILGVINKRGKNAWTFTRATWRNWSVPQPLEYTLKLI